MGLTPQETMIGNIVIIISALKPEGEVIGSFMIAPITKAIAQIA